MTVEADIERYLVRQVKALGGEVRKVSWPGRRHAPDRLILLPGRALYVELKRPGETPRGGQLRELDRLSAAGLTATWLSTREEIDFILGTEANDR